MSRMSPARRHVCDPRKRRARGENVITQHLTLTCPAGHTVARAYGDAETGTADIAPVGRQLPNGPVLLAAVDTDKGWVVWSCLKCRRAGQAKRSGAVKLTSVWYLLAILAAYGPAHRKVVADEDQLTAEADARAPRDSAAVQELFNRYVVGVRIVEMTDM